MNNEVIRLNHRPGILPTTRLVALVVLFSSTFGASLILLAP